MKKLSITRMAAVLVATFIAFLAFTGSALTPATPATVANLCGGIGEVKAKSVALTHAGVTEPQTSRLRVELDRDDGRTIYEVDFNVGRMEYEYDIDASNGKILEFDAEYDD